MANSIQINSKDSSSQYSLPDIHRTSNSKTKHRDIKYYDHKIVVDRDKSNTIDQPTTLQNMVAHISKKDISSYEVFNNESLNNTLPINMKECDDIIRSIKKNQSYIKSVDESILKEECKEDEIDPPSRLAIDSANEILKRFQKFHFNYKLHYYATDDQKVALKTPIKTGESLLIECDSNGDIDCFFAYHGKNSMASASNMDEFFDLHWSFFKRCAEKFNMPLKNET